MLQFAGQAGFNPQTQSRLPLFDYRPAGMSQSGPKLVFSFFFLKTSKKSSVETDWAQHYQAGTAYC